MNRKKELFITLTIVLLSFVIRVIRLDVPHDWSFDEVYHALSAEAYALNDPRGYEWWNKSPTDLAYEWLHPPIGKLMMALSINIFSKAYIPESKSAPVSGATSFAWRFPGVVFASLTVWLLIIFGKKLFNNFWIGAVAGGLYAIDGLSFVQSRTGMNDIYITFFVVLTFYRLFILIKDSKSKTLLNLFWVGIASGLAASTKWTGFYAVAIAFIWGELFLLKKGNWKNIILGGFYLGLVPFLVYILSYGQWWIQGHTIQQFYELHQQIWWYQTGLKATHGYQSGALTWPFLIRPVWFYVKYQDVVKNGVKELYIGNIYTMGNPIIWWAGLISILYGVSSILYRIVMKMMNSVGKIKFFITSNDIFPLSVILVGYFGMFVPWTFSPRIMFLYHYLPSIPFLCLALAYGLDRIRKIGEIGLIGGIEGKNLVIAYLVVAVLIFLYFYPQWTALPLPQKWVEQYYWLKSWK